MEYTTILYAVANKTATITLNRAEKRNAFNAQVVRELFDAFTQAANDENAKVIVLASTGDVFSAGADLGYLQSLQQNTFDENVADSEQLMALYKLIYELPKPVIAKIQGHAIAGGCGLATVCDFSFAVPEAQFGYTEVKIGFIPAIVMVFLLRKISERNARQLLLTGKLINAEEAEKLGLINAVVPKDHLDETVAGLCNELISQTSRAAVATTKTMIAAVQDMSLEDALKYAARMNATARGTADCQYGIQSFLDKKKPEWY